LNEGQEERAMIVAALLFQAAQPAPVPAAAPQPDIQLDARVTARRVVVENKGEVELTLRASLNGREGENNVLDVVAPELPQGRRELRNVDIRVHAEANIPGLSETVEAQEPPPPQ
jgi:hypothetical protein